MSGNGFKDISQSTVQVNKDHQYALKVYAERLEAELETVDKLLNVAELDEEESQPDIGGSIQVAGSSKPSGLLSSSDLLSQDSPFYDDAVRRQRYISLTEHRPMKSKELESLAEAVRFENLRIRAYEAQSRGEQLFVSQYSMKDLESTEGLDWERIATKVRSLDSTALSQRSAKECEIRWLGDRHPKFNHSPWTASEISAAKSLVEGRTGNDVDWTAVAEELGTHRTPIDVMRHTVPRKVHVWDAESDRRLIEAVKIYGTESWSLVARAVSEDAQMGSCQNRWYRTLDPSIRRGNWSPEEDAQLRLAVELYGHAWMEVASVIPGRNNEQCRDRWSERLNPKIAKGRWTPEEDAKLLVAVEELGTGKWKEVSDRVGTGRTDNTCRYRYESLKGQDGAEETRASDEVQATSATRQDSAASKPKRRSRKGKERSTTTDSVNSTLPASESSQATQPKPKPRARPRKKPQEQEGDQPSTSNPPASEGEADAQPRIDNGNPKSRPRARPVKRAKVQAQASPETPAPSQSTSQRSPLESRIKGTTASTQTSQSPDSGEERSGSATPHPSLKRPNATPESERTPGRKRRKAQNNHQVESTEQTGGAPELGLLPEG
ncbi:hypothetical protein BC834DRAFT_1016795, partial [Gloeopeniophorella convolvens]